MSNALSRIGTGITLVCDAAKIIETVDRIYTRNELPGMLQPFLANRLVLLGFTIAEVGMICAGAKSQSLEKLKAVEILPRVFNLPFEFVMQIPEKLDLLGVVSLVEKGILSPMTEIASVAAQCSYYQEKKYVEMSANDLKEARRPIYERDYLNDEYRITGYKPVDLGECQRTIDGSIAVANASALLRLATVVFDSSLPIYERLSFYLFGRRIPNQPAQNIQNAEVQDENEGLDLRLLSVIPAPLHGDAVFSKFICPISQLPIRDPVRDPTTVGNAKVLYEREVILRWLQINPTSPYTMEPLEPDELIECPALKLVIDDRLDHHSRELIRYFQNRQDDPINREDQEIIDQFI